MNNIVGVLMVRVKDQVRNVQCVQWRQLYGVGGVRMVQGQQFWHHQECKFTYTKGGPSNKRGGGQASKIIQHFEEKLQGGTKTDDNIAHSSDSYSNISFISSKKISFQASRFTNFQGKIF